MNAPEALKTGEITKAADVFSFGILVWQVCHKKLDPYPQFTSVTDAQHAIIKGVVPDVEDKVAEGSLISVGIF